MTQLIKLYPILLILSTVFSEEDLNFRSCLENERLIEDHGSRFSEKKNESSHEHINQTLFNETDGRSAVHQQFLWPNATVVYEIDPQVENSSLFVEKFKAAIEKFENKTCLKFERRDPNDPRHSDYIRIRSGDGCSSSVGRVGGKQHLTLAKSCYWTYVILHEMMHAIGFHHEMSRTDRDDYVTVHYENIKKDAKFNFRKYSKYEVNHLDTPFDYHSIMMYGAKDFSKNGQPTITPAKPGIKLGPVGSNLSPIDVLRVNRYYECFGEKRPKIAIRPEFVCDFEEYCNLFPLKRNFISYNWLIIYGRKGAMTGDHTTGTGHYYVFQNWNDLNTELRSKMIYTYDLQNACLSLYYILNGLVKGSSFMARISHSNSNYKVWTDLFEVAETEPGEWKEIRVDLTLLSDRFMLSFDASKVLPNLWIAIDDITIYWASCSEL